MRRYFLSLFVLGCALNAQAQTYTITPTAYQTVLDASGNPVSGACIWTYTAGTSTPATTYTTSAGVANTNPIQADSAGRFVAYLAPGSSYKYIYEGACTPPAHGTTIRTVDNISAMGLGSVQASDFGSCEGRMTLTSGLAVTSADVTAAVTVYFTPYKGNTCPTYDPTSGAWSLTTFAEVSIAIAGDAANSNYDLFGYSNSGTFTLERLVWTNATTRATGLVLQDGVFVKSGQTSRRYLGTYRTTGTIGQTEDSFAKRFNWNYYNRVPRALRVFDTTNTWTYSTATWRQANNSTANQVALVVGVAEEPVRLTLEAGASNTVAGESAAVSLREDTIGQPPITSLFAPGYFPVAAYLVILTAHFENYPVAGYHTYAWQEYSTNGGTTTWYGDNGVANAGPNSGIIGVIQG